MGERPDLWQIECSYQSQGIRLICGAAVAAFVARLAVEAMGVFL